MHQIHTMSFGPFHLNGEKSGLWHGEEETSLRPMPLAVLRYLAERPGELVPKEALLKDVWAGTYVTKTTLQVCIREIRQALGDEPAKPQFIETVGRRGYRFIAPLISPPAVRSLEPGVLSPTLSPSAPKLVGREQELQHFRRCLGKAHDGTRQVVFVTGEAGIGKTSVVETFLDSLDGQVRIGRGQCLEQYGQGEAYLPVLEALGQLCRASGREPDEGDSCIEVLRQYAPTWLVQMPALLRDEELSTLQLRVQGATQQRMLREMAEALEAMTAQQGLILWFEDLHWSDTGTLELIAYAAQRKMPARLLVIGSYRPAIREYCPGPCPARNPHPP